MSENRVPVMNLSDEVVENLITELSNTYGMVTPVMLYKEMVERGYYNQRTGKLFSRQAIYLFASQNQHKLSTRAYSARPLLVMSKDFPALSNWLHSKLVGIEVEQADQLSPAACKDRELYGFPNMACMLSAKSVHVLFINGYPALKDILLPGAKFTFREVVCLTKE